MRIFLRIVRRGEIAARETTTMRVLVCGDRNWLDQELVNKTLDEMHAATPITCVIEGEARGADKAGRFWAESRNVPFEPYPADWKQFGRAAGPIRNAQQLREGKPDYGLAFHDDIEHSKGTRDMVMRLKNAKVPYKVVAHGAV